MLPGSGAQRELRERGLEWEDAEQRRLMKRLGIKGKARGEAAAAAKPDGHLDLDKLFDGFEGSESVEESSEAEDGVVPRSKRPRRDGRGPGASPELTSDSDETVYSRSTDYSDSEVYSMEEEASEGEENATRRGAFRRGGGSTSGESEDSESDSGREAGPSSAEMSEESSEEGTGPSVSTSSECAEGEAGGRAEGGETAQPGTYVPPHLRNRWAAGGNEALRLQRKVRGLLNRMTAANLGPIVGELVLLRGRGALERRHAAAAVVGEVLRIGSAGARAALQGAAVATACVASFAGQVHDMEVGLELLTELARRLEQVLKGDRAVPAAGVAGGSAGLEPDAQAGVYLVLMVSHAFSVGLAAPRVVLSLLGHLCRRFEELDVSLMYHVLRSAGAELRAADPAGLRDFILAVQAEADSRRGAGEEGSGMTHRHATLLQVILEVKNNSQKWSMGASRHAVPVEVVKFVHRSGVGGVVVDVDWSKLLDGSALARFKEKIAAGVEDFALDDSDDELGLQLVGERQDLLKLAVAQRMNTDIRRKVFCAVMGADDYLDSVDRVLSLGLRGPQEREVARVLVDCCLQEKEYNPFYHLVARSLCAHSKQHRVSFRYAVADQVKELEGTPPRRARHLMRLAGSLVADGQIPLLVLQALPWEQGISKSLQPPLNNFVEAFFLGGSNEAVGGAFLRLGSSPGLETLRNGLALFLHGTFQKHILRAPERDQRKLLGRYKAALSGLNDDSGAW